MQWRKNKRNETWQLKRRTKLHATGYPNTYSAVVHDDLKAAVIRPSRWGAKQVSKCPLCFKSTDFTWSHLMVMQFQTDWSCASTWDRSIQPATYHNATTAYILSSPTLSHITLLEQVPLLLQLKLSSFVMLSLVFTFRGRNRNSLLSLNIQIRIMTYTYTYIVI